MYIFVLTAYTKNCYRNSVFAYIYHTLSQKVLSLQFLELEINLLVRISFSIGTTSYQNPNTGNSLE